MLALLTSLLAAALYSVSSARLLLMLQRASSATQPTGRSLTFVIATVGLVLHAFLLSRQTGWPDTLQLPFFTALSAAALGIVLLHLALCLREPADYLGLAAYPFAALALLASQLAGAHGRVIGFAVLAHVLLSLLAYAVLALATAQALLVALQRKRLAQHRPGGFIRALPPLERTESLLIALLCAGFVLLTLSLASGFFYLDNMFAQNVVHKTILSALAWLGYGLLLLGHWRFGWGGRRAVNWTLAASALLMTAYFGSKLVLELVLQRT